MGITRAANVVSVLIEKLKPTDVVVLGIAGSLSNDMEPGDVFIPDSINEDSANSATRGEGENWTFLRLAIITRPRNGCLTDLRISRTQNE